MKSFSIKQKGTFYAVMSGLLYSLLGYFGVSIMANGYMSISTMLFWRFSLATIIMACIIAPKLRNLSIDWIEMCKVSMYGIILYGPSTIVYFIASERIGTGLAMVIFFIYPAVVVLCNWYFYNIHITKIYYLAIALIILGAICMGNISTLDAFKEDLVYIGWGVLSAVLYAIYMVISKRSSLEPFTSTFCVSLGCAVCCFIWALVEHSFVVPIQLIVWTDILCISTICTAIPIVFLLKALQYISAEKTAILSVLEPVFVTIFGIVLLNESITTIQAIGVIIVLCGALITLKSENE